MHTTTILLPNKFPRQKNQTIYIFLGKQSVPHNHSQNYSSKTPSYSRLPTCSNSTNYQRFCHPHSTSSPTLLPNHQNQNPYLATSFLPAQRLGYRTYHCPRFHPKNYRSYFFTPPKKNRCSLCCYYPGSETPFNYFYYRTPPAKNLDLDRITEWIPCRPS